MLIDLKFRHEDAEEASRYFSRRSLLEMYQRGEQKLRSEWRVHFADGTPHWLNAEITLMEDPYNGHVKALIRMMDITAGKEEQLSILHRAENDAMTGLLRRDAGEQLIREHLAAGRDPGGILIALDLDDLKGINDSLGHAYGDEAISTLAAVLKGHFRSDDILVRAGGDEFMIFLPGAGRGIHSVERSLRALLKKLSDLSVGKQGERAMNCSIGCAVEIPGLDTFDTLYRRADLALYHVKRNGKNNVAVFDPSMEEEKEPKPS